MCDIYSTSYFYFTKFERKIFSKKKLDKLSTSWCEAEPKRLEAVTASKKAAVC